MFYLDSNAAIAVMNKTSSTLMARFIAETEHTNVGLPAVALFELRFGVAKSARQRENTLKLGTFLNMPLEIISFDAADAEEAGDIHADLRKKGTPIGPYDVLIAAQARCRGATLVTANTREFARVSGLRLEDWTLD